MKKTCLFILLSFYVAVATAQKPDYEKTMKGLVQQIENTIPGQSSYIPMANKMERVAQAEGSEWLPKYWVAFCYTLESFGKQSIDEKDQLLDVADKYLAEAEKLSASNDELEILKAEVASARLTADPSNRWQTYGQHFTNALATAEKINAGNPRIAYLRGASLFYTPEQFGGGKAIAKIQFEKALEQFGTFQPKSEIHPKWGKVEADYFISQCNQ